MHQKKKKKCKHDEAFALSFYVNMFTKYLGHLMK